MHRNFKEEIMLKKYLLYLLFVLFVIPASIAQEGVKNGGKTELNLYPNPVQDGKVYISSSNSVTDKKVEIFDVLGKQVLKAVVIKELNISSLPVGVYMVKITEGEVTVTRKLVVK